MTSLRLIAPTAKFGFNLLGLEAGSNAGKNVIVSPLSISTALGMTAAGARGATLKAMNKVLGLGDYGDQDNATNNAAYANLLSDIKGKKLGVKLSVANAIWANEGTPFDDAFFTVAMKHFGADVKSADFSDPETLEAINRWVKTNTQDKIEKILEEMGPDAVMYLLNALYFKGTWTNKFDKDMTDETATFHAADGDKQHPLMFRMDEMRYADQGDYQIVALPFGEAKRVHLYVLLPAKGKTAEQVAAGLDGDKFFQTCRGVSASEGQLWLPRFKLDYKAELVEPLTKLGMGEAFEGGADFSGMRKEKDLYISRVIHKCVCAFDEEGGELAAATAVEMSLECCVMGPEPWRMRVDRPFVAVLADEETGAVIGAGVVNNP